MRFAFRMVNYCEKEERRGGLDIVSSQQYFQKGLRLEVIFECIWYCYVILSPIHVQLIRNSKLWNGKSTKKKGPRHKETWLYNVEKKNVQPEIDESLQFDEIL